MSIVHSEMCLSEEFLGSNKVLGTAGKAIWPLSLQRQISFNVDVPVSAGSVLLSLTTDYNRRK